MAFGVELLTWDYGRLEWQQNLQNLEKTPNVAYENVLNKFDSVWCVEGLIIIRSNLSVTWKIRAHVGIISWICSILWRFSQGDMYFSFAMEFVYNLC